MKIQSKKLSVLAYSNGFTLWHYKTSVQEYDAKAFFEDGFFEPVIDILKPGDLIIFSCEDGRGEQHFVNKDLKLNKNETKD